MWVRQQKTSTNGPCFIDISKALRIIAVNGDVNAVWPGESGDRDTIISFVPTQDELAVLDREERNRQVDKAFADARLSCVNLMVAWRKHRNALYLEAEGTDWVTPTHATIGAE